MAGQYGDFTAGTVSQGAVTIVATSWTPLVSSGSSPLAGRRHVRLFARSKTGSTIALAYAQKNSDGTFTTPTTDIRLATVYPGGTVLVEPVSDKVQVYGRLLKKAAVTDSSARIVVTEYA